MDRSQDDAPRDRASETRKKPLEDRAVALSLEDFAHVLSRLPASHYAQVCVERGPGGVDYLVGTIFERAPEGGWKTCGQMNRHGPEYADHDDAPHPADAHADAGRCAVTTETGCPADFARLLFAMVEDFEPRTP